METYEARDNYESDSLTPEILAILQKEVTNECRSILTEVYRAQESGIQHIELSSILGKSPSNLSNLISKIRSIRLPDSLQILSIQKTGKNKFYKLTPLGRRYVEQVTAPSGKNADIHEFTRARSINRTVTAAVSALDAFRQAAGSEWEYMLRSLLDGGAPNSAELRLTYNALSDALCRCQMEGGELLSKALEDIKNEELTGRIRRHIQMRLRCYELLKPLLELEKAGSVVPFRIIDDVFCDLHPLAFSASRPAEAPDPRKAKPPEDALSFRKENPPGANLTSEEYDNILLGIAKLNREFFCDRLTKDDAVERWKTCYLLPESTSFYIAEKCGSLSLLWNR